MTKVYLFGMQMKTNIMFTHLMDINKKNMCTRFLVPPPLPEVFAGRRQTLPLPPYSPDCYHKFRHQQWIPPGRGHNETVGKNDQQNYILH